jgi:formyltetrahydrofolate-dependent phosphoribosylglycinamide formyltransferase
LPARVAVLVSGSGSNLQAIVDAERAGAASYEVVVVISNRPGVKALERARAAGVEALVLDHAAFASRDAFDRALDAGLRARHVDLVALAGFMRLLGPAFVASWRGRLLNVHPSLLPAFPGARAVRDSLAAGVARTGVTVHFVDEGVDTGPVISQEAVDVLPGDDESSLTARLREVEHRLFPRAISALARGLAGGRA